MLGEKLKQQSLAAAAEPVKDLNGAKFEASLIIRTMVFSSSDTVSAMSSYVTAAAGTAFIAAISAGSSISTTLGADTLAAWLSTCVATMAVGFAAKGVGTSIRAAKAAYEMGIKETERLNGSPPSDISPLPTEVQELVVKAAPFGGRWFMRHALSLDKYQGALSLAHVSNLEKRLVWLQVFVLTFGAGVVSGNVWWMFTQGRIPGV